MKKIIKPIVMAVMLACCALASAASKKSIVCASYPEYDWVMNILGNKARDFDVILLEDNGIALDSFEPSPKDIEKIASSDMFVYVGGESDEWVKKALSVAVNKDMQVVDLMDVLGDRVREEETVEGMQAEEKHDSHSHSAVFEEKDVRPRNLIDWNGTWQSVYPFVVSGELDDVCRYKADNDSGHDFDFYRTKFDTAYSSDIVTIKVNAPQIEYIYRDKSIKATYRYNGYAFRVKDDGSSQARFKFIKTGGAKDAPRYIVISDHCYKPSVPEHYHIFASNTGYDDIVWESTHYPTYYPESLTVNEIADDLKGIHGDEKEYDENIWLSLRNAALLTKELSSVIQKLDADNAALYEQNAKSYIEKLDLLDDGYKKTVSEARSRTVVFGDRLKFRYLMDDYGLTYYAAFAGCSPDTKATSQTVDFLSKRIDSLGLKSILTVSEEGKVTAGAVASNTLSKDQKILEMDPLLSVTRKEIKSGRTYLNVMQENLEVLKKALDD